MPYEQMSIRQSTGNSALLPPQSTIQAVAMEMCPKIEKWPGPHMDRNKRIYVRERKRN